jgi:Tfp pilus assembly protein PilW
MMAILNRLLSGRKRDEVGTSLIEMMVATLILAILSATVLAISLSLMDTGNNSNHRFQNLGEAQPVMDVLTRDIRTATSVSTASAQTITFVAALGLPGGATTVTFTLASTGTLTQTSVQPNVSGGGTTTSNLQLSSNIVYPGTGATPLFTYYDIHGNALSPVVPANVASVSINLVDNNDLKLAASAATLAAQVWLLNVVFVAS